MCCEISVCVHSVTPRAPEESIRFPTSGVKRENALLPRLFLKFRKFCERYR